MALVLKDRVKETNSATGTSNFALTGAVAGFRTFADIGNANTTYYLAHDTTANTWEAGIGTYTASGTTLSRDTVLNNSSGGTSKISFANAPVVWCDMPSGAYGAGVLSLLSGTASGTGGLAGTASPTFTGTVNGAAATLTGNVSAAALVPSSSSVPTNGIYYPSANWLGFSTNGTARGYFTSTGTFQIGTTTDGGWSANTGGIVVEGRTVSFSASNGNGTYGLAFNASHTGAILAGWFYNSSAVGSITTNGSATAYNTSSDETLKNFNVTQRDFAGIIDAINVSDAEFVAFPGDNVLSISAQQTAMVGYWDAVTPPNYENPSSKWAADYGRLAPLALWGVKDLRGRVLALEQVILDLSARISTLESP